MLESLIPNPESGGHDPKSREKFLNEQECLNLKNAIAALDFKIDFYQQDNFEEFVTGKIKILEGELAQAQDLWEQQQEIEKEIEKQESDLAGDMMMPMPHDDSSLGKIKELKNRIESLKNELLLDRDLEIINLKIERDIIEEKLKGLSK